MFWQAQGDTSPHILLGYLYYEGSWAVLVVVTAEAVLLELVLVVVAVVVEEGEVVDTILALSLTLTGHEVSLFGCTSI